MITAAEYEALGFSPASTAAETQNAINRAEQLIDLMTEGKVESFASLDIHKQEGLTFAVCNQAEEMIKKGLYDDLQVTEVRLGDYSYKLPHGGYKVPCDMAVMYLRTYGLMSPAAEVM